MRATRVRERPRARGEHAVAAVRLNVNASTSLTPLTAASGTAAGRRPVVKIFRMRFPPPIARLALANLRALRCSVAKRPILLPDRF